MKARLSSTKKTSAIELAVFLLLCPLAGVGAALACESAILGVVVAVAGLVAIATYGLVVNLGPWLRQRQEASRNARRLSVTEIAARRREATEPAPAAQLDTASDIAKVPDVAESSALAKPREPQRVVSIRGHAFR